MIKVEVEGTDGAGKTTALKYLIEQLQSKGSDVVETREVGSPLIPVCTELRKIILDPASNMSGEAMEFVFAAMRLENERHYKTLDTDFVISDRGWFSHLAYTDHNVSVGFTKNLYGLVEKITTLPDVVIYLNVSEETALGRRNRRGEEADVIELKGVEFQKKVRESFEKYIAEYSHKDGNKMQFIVIDANQDLENVKSQIDAAVDKLVAMQSSQSEKLARKLDVQDSSSIQSNV